MKIITKLLICFFKSFSVHNYLWKVTMNCLELKENVKDFAK